MQRGENETCVRRVGEAERDGGGRGFGYLRVGVNVLCSGSKAYASTAVRGFVPNGGIASVVQEEGMLDLQCCQRHVNFSVLKADIRYRSEGGCRGIKVTYATL